MLALGHALAQALGGRYGAPHGALNALTLPPALRFNAARRGGGDRTLRRSARERRPGCAGGGARAAGRLRAARDLGVPEEAPAEVAEAVAARPGAKANPRPVTPADVEGLLRSIW